MSQDKLDLLFQHCADLGIDVDWEDLGETKRGAYRRDEQRIVLSRLLTRRQAVSTLAHECGHEAFGDTCSTPPAERRAWEYAGAFLIAPWEYRRAESIVGHHLSALAIELDVTPAVIEGWRRWWATRGQHTAQESRLGEF